MNREKVLFLCSAAVVSAALYFLISTCPRSLPPATPIGCAQALPLSLKQPLTEQSPHPANSDRVNPFAPYTPIPPGGPTIPARISDAQTKLIDLPLPVPCPLPIVPDASLDATMQFVGVATLDGGEKFGLLRPTDGSPIIRVNEGSQFVSGGEKYTVKSIEKQSIHLTDAKSRLYELKDTELQSSVKPRSSPRPNVVKKNG